jgi:hypothetical protein
LTASGSLPLTPPLANDRQPAIRGSDQRTANSEQRQQEAAAISNQQSATGDGDRVRIRTREEILECPRGSGRLRERHRPLEETPDMAIDLDALDPEVRDEIERLRSVNTSMGAYLKIVEGALLAAWKAGEGPRSELMAKSAESLSDQEARLRTAWELVGEIVLRVPGER